MATRLVDVQLLCNFTKEVEPSLKIKLQCSAVQVAGNKNTNYIA